MRCLYIVSHYPLTPNFRGGGSAIYYEQLASIRALGHDIDLWHYATPNTRRDFEAFVAAEPDMYAHVRSLCRSVDETAFPEKVGFADRVRGKMSDVVSGQRVVNPMYGTVALRKLRDLVRQTQPDFIWAQHVGPAQIAVLQDAVPVVFSHHDWTYKVKALANRRSEDPQARRSEEAIATRAAAVVSGSASECKQLEAIGCRNVSYLPVAYEPPFPSLGPLPSGPPRLVHLGGLATTANRIGLERFFEVVWPALGSSRPELWVVGDLGPASPELREPLAEAVCTGFVNNLVEVLRPYDLHIVAWEHDTGTRTRVPLAFSYGQVVVAVRASVAGFPELANGVNCRLVDHLGEMPGVLSELIEDPAQRERLGQGARTTFESAFTRETLLPRYQATIDAAVSAPAHASTAAQHASK